MEKKKILIIVGFIVSICIIGLSIFMIIKTSNEVKQDKNGEVVNNIDKNNTIELSYDDINNLLKKYNINMPMLYFNDYTDYDDLSINYIYDIIKDDLDASYYNNIVFDNLKFSIVFYNLFGYDKILDLNKLEKYTKDAADAKLKTANRQLSGYFCIDNDSNCYFYSDTNEENKRYVISENEFASSEYKIEKFSKKDDTLEVMVKYMFIYDTDFSNSDVSIYSQYKINSSLNNKVESIDCSQNEYSFCVNRSISISSLVTGLTDEDVTKLFNKYYNKLNTYKWTFKYDNEHKNYYFVSLEKVK